MISYRLIGRKISPAEISSANAELSEAVEKWRMRDLSSECIKYESSVAKVQRCQIHVARNVLAKVPRKLKKEVAKERNLNAGRNPWRCLPVRLPVIVFWPLSL
jgi:transposase-like protein